MSFWDKYQLYVYVALLALASWWLQQRYEQQQAEIKVAENSPDFYSESYSKVQMDTDGLPKNQLHAKAMQHYKADGTTHLQQPVMTLFNANAAPWLITADSAILAADGDHLQLNGETHISREARVGKPALRVNTSDLNVVLSTHYAETAAWAEIVSVPNKTAGIGMEVTFVSPVNLKLLSKVKGRYEVK
ncbi:MULTISPECIES: LPS export ABC transporter periplasmic protein LptC [Methylomonas]|uniref:LPS export ABC transporter periplasmic protein LptC n=1 Tax=Methylomonas TaxID=416 RepID=UPI0012324E7D|nr:LPS export ABC transporter periplasmic protein LptC [Methylomonas rhizoryzae]